MQRLDGHLVLSASDLNDYLACEHLTGLELAVLDGGPERPAEKPANAELLARLGDEHERRYLEQLRANGVEVREIQRSPTSSADRAAELRRRADETIAAMRAGIPAIAQATFFDGTWLGHADVLRRVETASALGAWSYEVEDAKLARSTKPYFLLQLCFYSAFVERVQGAAPAEMHVVLGDGTRRSFRVGEFSAYYRFVRARLEERVAQGESAASTYPDPVSHCGLCVWDDRCSRQRRRDDALSGVANLTRVQARRLQAAGIPTLAVLANAQEYQKPQSMERATFEKLVRQARLQVEQRNALAKGDPSPYRYELLPPPQTQSAERREVTETRGFALLPASSSGDVFFDMEGDPYYDVAESLEYLFGAHTLDDGFIAFWGCDRSGGAGPWRDRACEKKAFEGFVDFVMERRARHPGMHVYHYATYEKRALTALAQRHATREDEVDVLLREERLVDLYRVVRQTVAVGQPGYGLKKMEAFFGGREAGAIAAGDQSVIEFERWRAMRASHGASAQDCDGVLNAIEAYNRQDCESTAKLLDWLRERRNEAQRVFGVTFAPLATKAPGADEGVRPDPHADLKEQLLATIPRDFDPDSARANDSAWPNFLLLHLLDYHWREEKPVWWAFYDRIDTFADDPTRLLDDGECIIDLQPTGERNKVKQSYEYFFTFPPQEIKIDGGTPYDAASKAKAGSSFSIVKKHGRIELRLLRGPVFEALPLPRAVIDRTIFPSKPLRDALARLTAKVLIGHGVPRAAYDLLLGAPPRFTDRAQGERVQPDRVDDETLAELIATLDDSYLFVQGPPGSGKTYLGARTIVRLLARGLRIGITAHSHKAIDKLLGEVELAANERNVRFEGQRKVKDETEPYRSPLGANSTVLSTKAFSLGEGGLYAGTVWAFAGEDTEAKFDVLVIDEAGQLALPNAVAAAICAKCVLLLGDPLQLSHVHHTSHPGDVGVSVLTRLLGPGQRPVAQDRGVLLERSWRMHPAICAFISNLMYENRLTSVPDCASQRIDAPGLRGSGIRYIPVEHTDARVRSADEARVIADRIEDVLTGTVTERSGVTRPLKASDVIVVTPFNAQRRCIEAELAARGGECEHVRVGTVDKFQGQEAHVVFFSSAASDPEEAQRGVEFIFDRNRLNVAVSRARALAVYVGSPELLRAVTSSVERMRALSAGCALVECGSKPADLSPFIARLPLAELV